ncbi:hypothetical protein BUY19_01275 [Staphylococcus cohnii]|nr:hypothetical protein BUY19_01275 [Staphylococcus cohnii]
MSFSDKVLYYFYNNERIKSKLKGLSPKILGNKPSKYYTKPKYNFWGSVQFNSSECFLFIQYFVLLVRFLKGRLHPIVFSLSCSLKRLAKAQRFLISL